MQTRVRARRTAGVALLLLTLVPAAPAAATAPGAPTGVVAVAGERSATVSWSAPADEGDSPVSGYVVTTLPSGPELHAAGDVTELVVTGLQAGTPYRFAVAAANASGTGPAAESATPVVPTAIAPDTTLLAGPPPGGFTTRRSARLTWTGDDGVTGYRCGLDGRRRTCTGESLRLRGLSAGTHTFTVAARDADGDVDQSPARRTWTVPRDDRDLTTHGPWRRGCDRAAFRGSVTRTRQRGAALTSPGVDVREIVLVATVFPRAGSVAVFLGSHRLGRFDLSAPLRRRRQLIRVAAFPGVRSGQIRVVVRSRGKPVVVDGLGVENWFPAA